MLHWTQRKAKKSGFIFHINRKSLTNLPTVKSRFKLVRLGWGTGIRFSSRRRKAAFDAPLLRSSVSRGSDVPQARHSLPLPFESLYFNPAKAKRTPEGVLCFGWGTGILNPSSLRSGASCTNRAETGTSLATCTDLLVPIPQAKREGSTMCYLLFLAGAQGFEPRKCQSQSLMPYRLAMPQYFQQTIL